MRRFCSLALALISSACTELLESGDATFDGGATNDSGTTNDGAAEGGVTMTLDFVRLESPTREKRAYFGAAMATDGTAFLAAMPGASVGDATRAGVAYLYERVGSVWSKRRIERPNAKNDDGVLLKSALPAEQPVAYMGLIDYWPGTHVALRPDVAAIGWAGVDNATKNDLGTVCVYDRAQLALPRECLTPDDLSVSSAFGLSLSFSSTQSARYLVVGAPGAESRPLGTTSSGPFPHGGAAYVFVEQDGKFVLQAKLLAPVPREGDFFGTAVAVDGDSIAVGAPAEDGLATGIHASEEGAEGKPTQGTGAVYVYRRVNSQWTFNKYVKPFDASVAGFFGLSVALKNDILAIGYPGGHGCDGTPGRLYPAGGVFAVRLRAGEWTLESRDCYWHEAITLGGGFGFSVDVLGGDVIVGAPLDAASFRASGFLYWLLADASGGFRFPPPKMESRPSQPGAGFGSSVARLDNYIAVGAPLEDGPPSVPALDGDYGGVYVFSTPAKSDASAP